MSQSLVILPLDDRPPNYEFPALLTEAAGYQPKLPPKSWLGTPWRVGQMAQLAAWLAAAVAGADALVVALDTLGYGGLVNSRRSTDTVETVLARLQLVRDLKTRNPALTILGYNILMRVTRGNDNEEEKAYWGVYGARLFRISYLEDRLAMHAGDGEADEQELTQLRREVPAEIVTDYLAGRARNHAVNRAMIEWTAAGVFDYLIIPQDDTMAYGWNIAEARTLRLLARQLGVADRVSVYPGTDETDLLLLARYAAQQANVRPTFWTRYSSVRAGQVITAYEDRPMAELIKAHLGPLGGVLVNSPAEADILLYVNSPAEVQGNGADQYALLVNEAERAQWPAPSQAALAAYLRSPHLRSTLRELHSVQRDVAEFARSLAQALQAGYRCAVVDVAYVNGADLALGDALHRTVPLAQLAGYGGWNTAGNTLGTVLAHAVIRHIQCTQGATAEALAAHIKFLFLRFVDDLLYQGRIRSEVAAIVLPVLGERPRMTNLGGQANTVRDEVAQRLTTAANQWATDHFVGQTISASDTHLTVQRLAIHDLFLPWDRLFEVGFAVDLLATTQVDP